MKDGHVHSHYCLHGSDDTFQMYIENAIKAGIDEISFTEHFPLPRRFEDPSPQKDSSMDVEELEKYIKELQIVKKFYSGVIKINIGVEVDYIEGFEEEIKELLNKYGKDFEDSILSVHMVKYNSKYYCIDYQIHGDKVIISGQPGVGDVTKQYLYQLAFDDFIMKQGYRYVQNMFFCPDEVGDKQYGWVQMEILNHIGNKRLENIAVVKLCASKMYQLYLDNQTISEHEINQYIADIGRQEISEQNFANRMLAYLMRITNASKMAEEKLEMKADKGKLIYPRQIKRELGAKIIYDAICPVASKAFYGFNPYEKENYGTMVAEDIGNSYGRCNQIADASIEIEKKIKELSEKELQDEKVIIDILRKCFEGKEDIASMAEGDNLEMLVEKVMELVRNLYL